MSRFASEDRCLECRASLLGASVCSHCGLVQAGPDADRLRQLLNAADEQLALLRASSSRPPVPDATTGATPTAATTTAGTPMPGMPTPGTPTPDTQVVPAADSPPQWPAEVAARRGTLPAFSTPAVLLGLGAISVLVAAVVFVSVAWSDLTLAAKAMILLGVTALIGAAGAWSVRKPLRGSAESFTTLFALFVVVDFVAAQTSGLAGLDALGFTAASWVVSMLLLVAGGGWALIGIRARVERLVGVQLLAAAGVAGLAATSVDQLAAWRIEYVVLAWAVLTAVVAVLTRRVLVAFAVAVRVVSSVLFALAWLASLSRLVDPTTFAGLWAGLAPAGWVLSCGLLAAVAFLRPLPAPVRRLAATGATAGVVLLLMRPLEGSSADTVVAVATGVTLGLSAAYAFLATRGPWHTAVGVTAAGPFALALLGLVPPAAEALGRAVAPAEQAWRLDLTSTVTSFDTGVGADNASVIGFAVLGLAVVCWLLGTSRLPAPPTTVLLLAVAAAVVALRPAQPLWSVVAVVVGLALVCAVVALARRSLGLVAAATGLAALSLVAASGSDATTLVVAVLLTAILAVLTSIDQLTAARALAAGTVASGALGLAAGLAVVGLGRSGIAFGLAILGAVVVVAAQVRRADAITRLRNGVELGGLATSAVALGLSLDHPELMLPLAMTVTGAALAAVAIMRADRRNLAAPAGVLIAAATWVRLWVEDVTVIEPYTLPSALVVCAVGTWRMLRRPGSSSLTSLSPGLMLALLPSLLAALPDPTSLRALVLGLSAVLVLLTGAVLRWAAPLLLGAGTALVLVVVNVAPYAAALPRWVVLATVGFGLLFLGVTWEHRLRDARTLASAVNRLQ